MEAPELCQLCLVCWEWDEARYAEAIYILSTDCHAIPQSTRYTSSFHPFAVFFIADIDSSNNAGSTMMILYDGDEWIVFHGFSLIFVYYVCVHLCAYVSLLLITAEGGRSGHF